MDRHSAASANRPSTPASAASPGALPAPAPRGEARATAAAPTIGRYRNLGEIARSSTGVVYRAYEPALERDVAVKVLHDRLRSSPAAVRAFLAEAKITGQLQHPGIPPIFEVGYLADGSPYLATKMVPGRTLAELQAEQTDLAHDRVRLIAAFEQVCQTLAFAHGAGVLHRNLGPENVLIGTFGEVHVTDWGQAQVLAGGKRPATGASPPAAAPRSPDSPTPGVPGYMAPEQARGEFDRLDARADVFALGGLLSLILTGQPPFASSDPAKAAELCQAGDLSYAFLRLDSCGADPRLVLLAKRCLCPEASGRPRDAGAVVTALAECRMAEPKVEATENVRLPFLGRVDVDDRTRRRVLAGLTALGVAAMLGSAIVAWRADRRADRSRDESILHQSEFDKEKQGLAEQEKQALAAQAVELSLVQAERALAEGDVGRAAGLLDQADQRAAGAADSFRPRLARRRADLDLLRELDRVEELTWAAGGVTETVTASWLEAFRRVGIAPGSTPSAEAAARAAESLVRDRMVAALDRWLAAGRSPDVLAVLTAVDPDAYRQDVRAAIRAGDDGKLRELVGRAEALHQPAWFAAVLGINPSLPAERQAAILEAAFQQRPGDAAVLMALGGLYPPNQPDGAEDRVRWYQAAVAARPGSPSSRSHLGLALLDKGDPAGAATAFRDALRLDPKSAALQYRLGLALHAGGDVDGALAAFRDALALDPKMAKAHYSRGLILESRKDTAGAVAAFRDAVKVDPLYATAHARLGRCLWALGEAQKAVEALKTATTLDPKDAASHHVLGLVLKSRGDTDAAIRSFKEAVRIDPSLAPAHFNLAVTLDAKGETGVAVASFQEAVKLDPNLTRAQHMLAVALDASGDTAGAAVAYKKAIDADPRDAAAHNGLGLALRAKGDLDGAVAAFRDAGKVDPNFAAAHANLGAALRAKGDLEGAVEACRWAVRADSKYAPGHTNLGVALWATGDLNGALTELREAVRLNPNLAAAHNSLGAILGTKGDSAGAVSAFRDAVKADPKLAVAHYNLGRALWTTGDASGAVSAFHESVRLDPKSAIAHYTLGVALAARGDVPGSQTELREAARLDPKTYDKAVTTAPPPKLDGSKPATPAATGPTTGKKP